MFDRSPPVESDAMVLMTLIVYMPITKTNMRNVLSMFHGPIGHMNWDHL